MPGTVVVTVVLIVIVAFTIVVVVAYIAAAVTSYVIFVTYQNPIITISE